MLKISWASIGTIAEGVLAGLSRLSIYLPLSWRGASALILGVLLAKWWWVLFAPHATFTAALPERASAAEAGQLFGISAAKNVAAQGVALPNVQLLGIFAASAGKKGFAILKLDNKRQTGVAEGEEVATGTRLVAVHDDHVLLERAGVQQRVNLETQDNGSRNTGSRNTSTPHRGTLPGINPGSAE